MCFSKLTLNVTLRYFSVEIISFKNNNNPTNVPVAGVLAAARRLRPRKYQKKILLKLFLMKIK